MQTDMTKSSPDRKEALSRIAELLRASYEARAAKVFFVPPTRHPDHPDHPEFKWSPSRHKMTRVEDIDTGGLI